MFRRAMEYLGLGPDDAYDDFDASAAPVRPRNVRTPNSRRRVVEDDYEDEDYVEGNDEGEYDYEPPRRSARPPRADSSARARMGRDDSGVVVRPSSGQSPTVRTLPTASAGEPMLFTPQRYDEVREIADVLKSGRSVKMDISTADSTTAHRLIDFVSGLVYAVDGGVDKVAPGVFLVRPHGGRVRR